MEGKDNIKELFSQKLGNYEAPVNPELWANISSQVAAGTATTTATGLSVLAKVAIGVGVSVAAITTVVLLTSSPEEIVSEEPAKEVKVQQETPTSTTTNKQEQVAEVSDEKLTFPEDFRDVTTYLGNSSSNKETSETSSNSTTPNNQKTTTTPNPEPLVDAMPTKGTTTIVGDKTSEPTIVEGVTYGSLTNYGGAPTNAPDPEQLETASTPKLEPIKRYVNVFTPNGDGRNDYFELESEGLTDFSVVVFNPSGDIVFQSNDPAFRWDGSDKRTGEMVESGSYMYMVSAYDSEGEPFPIYERLMIQR
ncbi:MAG: gliding motility-associated C-terminal domain-containing protein [Crocinitomicaceae bacterium]